MARGKEALQSARQRYEAALEHIDRLTTELAEAKIRARTCEAEANRVPGLLRENDHLRELISQSTSDEVRKLRTERDERLSEQQAENDRLREFMDRLLGRLGERHPDENWFSEEEIDFIRSRALASGPSALAGFFGQPNRALRRHVSRGRKNPDTVVQDNRRELGDNLDQALGMTRGVV